MCEAYREYAPIDPDAQENKKAVDMTFVSQSAADSRQNLQWLEEFEGMNRSQLLEIAQKVYNE